MAGAAIAFDLHDRFNNVVSYSRIACHGIFLLSYLPCNPWLL